MKPACRSFRSLLEEKLVGRPDPLRLSSLSWHEHLLGCGACRALFESEETLEVLLATLPEPNLPPEIKRRVLAALARSKTADRELDRLLSRGMDVSVPANLAQDILARLEPMRAAPLRAEAANVQGADVQDVAAERDPARDARLDALLDKALAVNVPADIARLTLSRLEVERGVEAIQREARLDALLERAAHVTVPGDLSDRILTGLAPARRVGTRRLTRVRSAWIYAAAALVVATLLCWALWPKRSNTAQPDMVVDPIRDRDTRSAPVQPDGPRPDDQVARAPDPNMLAQLEVLENWDILMPRELDVLLGTTDRADELLLDYQEGG